MLKVAIMYSGVGGANGADYVAEMLMDGFREYGADVHVIGNHGQYDEWKAIRSLPAVDFIVHSSGYNLTPGLIMDLQQTAPVFAWSFTDEIPWWQTLIAKWTHLVDIHFSYTKGVDWGPHVQYMPLACAPSWYHPIEPEYSDTRRNIDVCMVGAVRTWRKLFCDILQAFFKCQFSWQMAVPTSGINALYAHTKVVVAPVQDCDEDSPGRAWGCPCRTFDVRGTRTFQLETYRGGLPDVYPDGAKVPTKGNVFDAARQWRGLIEDAIADFPRRKARAEADYAHTMANHLYRHRAEQIVEAWRAL